MFSDVFLHHYEIILAAVDYLVGNEASVLVERERVGAFAIDLADYLLTPLGFTEALYFCNTSSADTRARRFGRCGEFLEKIFFPVRLSRLEGCDGSVFFVIGEVYIVFLFAISDDFYRFEKRVIPMVQIALFYHIFTAFIQYVGDLQGAKNAFGGYFTKSQEIFPLFPMLLNLFFLAIEFFRYAAANFVVEAIALFISRDIAGCEKEKIEQKSDDGNYGIGQKFKPFKRGVNDEH